MESRRTLLEELEPGTLLRIAGWEVEPSALLLRRDGEEERLEPRVMGLLVCLAQHAGHAVTRDELMDRVWSDVIVSDDALHSAVSKLRRALGNGEADAGKLIQTVPKIGYRLVAPVEWRSEPRELGEPVTVRTPPTPPSGSPADRSRRGDAGPFVRWLAWGAPLVLGVAGILLWSQGNHGADPSLSRPDVRPLTSWPGLEVEPAFAPGSTGDRIAFAWQGPAQDNWDIWIQVVGAGDPLRLTSHPGSDHSPTWSPDGRHLAFLRYEGGGCTVVQVPALGGSERQLARCAGAEGLTWSPDGRSLLWSERPSPGEPFRVVELDLEDLARRELTRPAPGSVGDLGPAVSPDGSTLAFLRSPVLGVEDIHLMPVSGGEARRLTRDSLKIHGLDWMPDGRSLVYSSNRGGLFSLWRVGLDGGEPEWLGASGGDLDAPSVGHAGRRIAYEQWNDDTNIYRLSLVPGARPTRVLGSTRWDWAPDLAPVGERIVFVSDRTGSSELWVGSLRESEGVRQLTQSGGPYVNHPRWNPGGTAIAFDARPGGNADVYVLEEGAPRPRRLTDHPAQDVGPTWSRDGRSVYFASDRGGSWELWKVAAGGGDPLRVTEGGGYCAQESSDGRWLYFSRRHEPGIRRRPLAEEGPVELVVEDLAPLDRSHWLVTDDSVLYIRRPAHDRPVLARMDLSSRHVETLSELGAVPYNSGLALGPRGDSILFTRTDRLESDILLLERGG